MDNRDFTKYIEALEKVIENTKSEISEAEKQKKCAEDFQFIKNLCGKELLFCGEDQKVDTGELANALMVDEKQTNPLQMNYPIERLKRRLQNCYTLIDELKKIQAANR